MDQVGHGCCGRTTVRSVSILTYADGYYLLQEDTLITVDLLWLYSTVGPSLVDAEMTM